MPHLTSNMYMKVFRVFCVKGHKSNFKAVLVFALENSDDHFQQQCQKPEK